MYINFYIKKNKIDDMEIEQIFESYLKELYGKDAKFREDQLKANWSRQQTWYYLCRYNWKDKRNWLTEIDAEFWEATKKFERCFQNKRRFHT